MAEATLARVRYTVAALAGAASIALTGATASVVMTALQTAVPSDALDLVTPQARHPQTAATGSGNSSTHQPYTPGPLVSVAAPIRGLTVDEEPVALTAQVADDAVVDHAVVDQALVDQAVVDQTVVDQVVDHTSVLDLAITTSVFDLIPESLRRLYDPDPRTGGPTRVHSVQDAQTGTVTITAGDPDIGERTLVLPVDARR